MKDILYFVVGFVCMMFAISVGLGLLHILTKGYEYLKARTPQWIKNSIDKFGMILTALFLLVIFGAGAYAMGVDIVEWFR